MSTNAVIVDWPVGDPDSPDRHHFEIPRGDAQTLPQWLQDVNTAVNAHWVSDEPILLVGVSAVVVSWEGTDPFSVVMPNPPPHTPPFDPSQWWRALVLNTIAGNWSGHPPV